MELSLCNPDSSYLWGQVNLGSAGQPSFFSSRSVLSTPTGHAAAQEVGILEAFCGQSCPLQLLHKSAKEILYIPRNGADFTGRPAKQGQANPRSLPSLHCQGIWKFRTRHFSQVANSPHFLEVFVMRSPRLRQPAKRWPPWGIRRHMATLLCS